MTVREVRLILTATLLVVARVAGAAMLEERVERSAIAPAAGHPDRTSCASAIESLGGREPWRLASRGSAMLPVTKGVDADSTRIAESPSPLGTGRLLSFPTPIHDVTTADLDQDGDLDVLALAQQAGKVITGWNDGSGAFEFRETPVTRPRDVDVGDLDGDGVLDLLVLGVDPGTVVMLEGSGGGFDSVGTRSIGTYLHDLVAADLDGDGTGDFAMADDGTWIKVLRSGDGFRSVDSIPAWDAWEIVAADMNRDGALDLVASTGCGTVDVYFNLGGGRFDTPVVFPVQAITSLAAGDLDGDGWCDVVGVQANYTATILWNDGHGYFDRRDDHPIGFWVLDVAVGDLDADGRLDFAVSGSSSRQTSWARPFFQRGGRSFDASTTYNVQSQAMEYSPHFEDAFLTVGDLDGRGGPEILVELHRRNETTGRVQILRHIAGRAFAGMALIPTSGLVTVQALDLQGRGRPALLVNQGAEAHLLECAPGDGLPGNARPFPLGTGARVHDFNADGRGDLIHAVADGFEIRLTDEEGTPGAPRHYAQPFPVLLGEFDGDGLPDLVMRGADDTLLVALNDGAGGFAAPLRTDASVAPLHGERPFAFGDVDGDGDTDLLLGRFVDPSWGAAGASHPDSIEVWRCDAVARFRHVGTYPLIARPSSSLRLREIVAQDVNGDGLDDAIGLSHVYSLFGMASVLPGLATAGLGSPTGVMLPDESPLLFVHDVTDDGFPDLVSFGMVGGGKLKIAINLGDGTFKEPERWLASPDHVRHVAAGDFNGDGTTDVAFSNSGDFPGIAFLLQHPDRHITSARRVMLEATVVSGAVVLTAHGPSDADGEVLIERRDPTMSWRPIARMRPEGARVAFEDRAVAPGSSYLYRVRWEGPSGPWLSDEVGVTVPSSDLWVALDGSHPSRGSVIVRLGLSPRGPGRLELLDLAGRRLESRTVTDAATRWQLGKGLASGLYWVRLSQAGRSVTRKVVITR